MRVAIVSPDASSQSGGVERFCHTLRAALEAEAGWDVRVVSAGRDESWMADCVITNGMTGAVMRGGRRVHVYHGCWPEHMKYDHRAASRVWRVKAVLEGGFREFRAGSGATRVAVSNSAAREIRKWYGLRSVVIPNAVDTALFHPRSRSEARQLLGLDRDARLALFPGRGEDRKRPDLALEACRRAGFSLVHAGASRIDGATELGPLAPADLALWYAAVDAVISSSDYEAASLAVLESLAVGTPVVGTRVGWLADLEESLPEYKPLLANRGDAVQLAVALEGLGEAEGVVAAASALVQREHGLRALGIKYAALLQRSVRE
jgi:glycosyltransferase involved in cell wall biosynthesis